MNGWLCLCFSVYACRHLHAQAYGALLMDSVGIRIQCSWSGTWKMWPLHSCPSLLNLLPLSSPEVALGTATQEATRCVGTTIAAGVALLCTLIHILAASKVLVETETRGADTVETAKSIVARGTATSCGWQGTLIFICRQREKEGHNGRNLVCLELSTWIHTTLFCSHGRHY